MRKTNMADIKHKRQVKRLLSERLDSYYEALMEAARRDVHERWERLVVQAAGDEAPASLAGVCRRESNGVARAPFRSLA